MVSPSDIVQAKPSKAFFIDMITRDLTVTDSILDLVDNSIDQAVERQRVDVMTTLTNGGSQRFKAAEVSLKCSPKEFVIEDTCGGISVSQAKDKVFLFGNPTTAGTSGGLSVYGIGMKRAFFKLGKVITVESATDKEWFKIDIDVEEWRQRGDDDWTFHFTETGKLGSSCGRFERHTTRIRVGKLHEDVGRRLGQVSFAKDLAERIAGTYSLFLNAGVKIVANGQDIASTLPTVVRDGKLRPARKVVRKDDVDILIVAGVSPREDKAPRGWYVFCNGRMVLGPERSHLTGWGEGLPQWHGKFGHFVGYAYFHSSDVRKLPWTTTKQGIVFDSSVYQAALGEMKLQARPVLNFLSDMYPDDAPEQDVPEREVLSHAKAISIDQLPRESVAFKADMEEEKKKNENRQVRIQYSKPQKKIDLIRQQLRKPRISASAVGVHTFDYYIEQECR